MKFKNYLENITGVGVYPLISLIVFVVFFGLVSFYVIRGNKSHFERLRNLPINDNETI
jgi:hypothetical protein